MRGRKKRKALDDPGRERGSTPVGPTTRSSHPRRPPFSSYLTVSQLAGFLQHRLFGLLDDDRLEPSVIHERTSPRRVSVLKSLANISIRHAPLA